jgi:hypothetical protein
MKGKKATLEEWRLARILWETDPLVSHSQLAQSLGVSRGRVTQVALAEGWQRSRAVVDATSGRVDTVLVEGGEKPALSATRAAGLTSSVPVDLDDPESLKSPPARRQPFDLAMLLNAPGKTLEQRREYVENAIHEFHQGLEARQILELRSLYNRDMKLKDSNDTETIRNQKMRTETIIARQLHERRLAGIQDDTPSQVHIQLDGHGTVAGFRNAKDV